jgi:hypothetical protein
MREIEIEIAELRVELTWTRRAAVAILLIQGGNLAAQVQSWFS